MRVRFVNIVIIIIILFLISGCYRNKEKLYYLDVSNFIKEEATVDNVLYDEENKSIYFWLSNIDDVYQDSTFIVDGDNVNVLLQYDIINRIMIGDTITFSSAPRYFGDGYCMPIIELIHNNEELLSFDEGHKNLMKRYR